MQSLRLLTAISLVLLLACGGDDDRKHVSNDICAIDNDHCDIEDDSCLESLLDLTICAREGDGNPAVPPVQRITAAEFADRLRGENTETPPTSPWDLVLPKLSLIPAGKTTKEAAIELLADSVAAFYDDETHDITIITDTKVHDTQEKMYVVMHELTHFLQGRDHSFSDLRKEAGPTSDNRAALASLIEGEATVTSTRGLVWLMNRSPTTLDWERYFDSLDGNIIGTIKASESPLLAALQALSYSIGGRYIEELWDGGDRADVDALFAAWPHTLRAWLDGPWHDDDDDLDDDHANQVLTCAPPLPPNGFQVFELESFGVAGAFALLTAAGRTDLALAQELTDDAFALYVADADADAAQTASSAVGIWRMRFKDGPEDYLKAISSLDLDTQVIGDELTIRVESDTSTRAFTDEVLATCPKRTELQPKRSEPSLPAAIRQLHHPVRRP